MGKLKTGAIIAFVLTLIGVAIGYNTLFETNERGHYQIKQAAFTGTMTARMVPGTYGKWFGDIDTWDKAETFYYTSDYDGAGDVAEDRAIEVRFNDGSIARISGTARILLPITEQEAISLVVDMGYRDYATLEQKLILPTVRNALRTTANLMSARQSYSEKRVDFVNWARDQIQNGLYKTAEETRKVLDVVSGEMVTRTFKVRLTDAQGNPVYEFNPLVGTGIQILNFEIKTFNYTEKVQVQIAAQQEAIMAVETARAKAKEAEQNALTVEAQGKAEVMRVRYDNEKLKIAAVVTAEKELDVARLAKLAAVETRQKEILLGQGEAERKRLVLAADGALALKGQLWKEVNFKYAEALQNYQGNWVPQVVMGGAAGGGAGISSAQAIIDLFMVKTARDLTLDMTIPRGAIRPATPAEE